MNDVDDDLTGDDQLILRFGTPSPFWRLSTDSDALHLSGTEDNTDVAVALTASQAQRIRNLTGVTSHLEVDLTVFGDQMKLHLVGRRVDSHTWAGTAADYRNTSAVARDLENGLSFAEQVVSEVNSLVVIIDSDGKIKRFNRLCEELTGRKEEDLLGMDAHELFMPESEHAAARANIRDFFATGQSFEVERPVRSTKGLRRVLWRNKLVKSGSGGDESYLVCSGTDITEERLAKDRLLELANTDGLTGLPNRHAMQELIRSRIEDGSACAFGLLFLDLDNFKKVNDHYGHMTGDALIQAAAVAIKGCLRDGDVIARWGGDEFLVLVHDADHVSATAVAQRIQDRMKIPFALKRAEVYSGCSIGIAIYPEHGETAEMLVRNADVAMYNAKDAGRHTFRIFTAEMNNRVSEYVWLDTNLRKAFDENQFELHYQPKLNLKTGKTESVEALVRWHSPERGMIGPLMFIPYAEESGLIVPLGKWVMETAARQAAAWRAQGRDIRIAINVSARQLRYPQLIEDFHAAITSAGVHPSLLDLELTESCLIDDEALAHDLMRQFAGMGAEIHLDDFGTGYSSLSQLSRLPINAIKLDRSFISSIHDDANAKPLVCSMVAVAQQLKLKVIAEGVENQEQIDFLRAIGVDYAQGYLFGKPMAAAEFDKWSYTARGLRSVA